MSLSGSSAVDRRAWIALERRERVRSLILAASGPGQFRDDKPVTRGVPLKTAFGLIEHGYES